MRVERGLVMFARAGIVVALLQRLSEDALRLGCGRSAYSKLWVERRGVCDARQDSREFVVLT